MSRPSSAEVFTPTSFPTYTYVQRDELHHERLLREWTRSSTQIASVSGPSKAGKTVLVQRVVGEGNLITVSGASVRPEYRFCTDMGVCPCLSSRVAVGSPWAEIQVVLART